MNDQLNLDKLNRYQLIRESLVVAILLTIGFGAYTLIRFEWDRFVIFSFAGAVAFYAVILWRLSIENALQATRIVMLFLWAAIFDGMLVFGILGNSVLFFSAIFSIVATNLLLNRKYAFFAAALYLIPLMIEILIAVVGVSWSLAALLPYSPEDGIDVLFLSTFMLLSFIIVRGLSAALRETERTSEALTMANERLLANEKRLQSTVTERTRELKESEEKNRAMVEAIPDVMSRATVDGIYTDFRVPTDFPNREVVAVERIGRSFYDFIPQEQADFFVETIRRTVETGERITYEYRSEPADLFIEARITKVNEREAISVLRDVTARRKAEMQLRQSEARNRALVSVIPDVMARVTRAGDYLDFVVPDDFPQFEGVVIDRVGSNLREYFSAENTQTFLRGINHALDTGSMVQLEYERPELSMWFELRIVPSQQDAEATIIVRNITLQKQERKRLQEIINSIPSAVIIWSHEEPWKVLWANEIACQMIKIPAQELIGRTWDLSSFFDDQSAGAEIVGQVSREEAILNKHVELNMPEIGPTWYRMSLIHLSYARSRAFMFVAEDVNEQRRANQILQRVQKLDSLGVLAGGIAHDFNNLLTSIIAQTSIAQHKAETGQDGSQNLQKSLAASKKASGLIQQMLAFSGQGQFEIREMCLVDIVKENLSFLHASLPKEAKITFEPSARSTSISADGSQVQQVLMNLILNAAQAIDARHHGEIVVKIDEVQHAGGVMAQGYTSASLQAGPYARLTVCDNGLGMDAETQSRIFEPFFTTKAKGHGLGLAAVVGIMRGHSGEIIVHSTLNVGTEIQLLFPLVETFEHDETTSTGTLPRVNSDTYVLVIDDEKFILEVMEDVLAMIDQPVMIAEGGLQGIQTFSQNRERIGLVILDLSMPDMNGSEVFVKLREMQPDIPVILCSGYSEQEATRKFIGQGLAGFLQKPFDVDQLVATVSNFLRESAAVA